MSFLVDHRVGGLESSASPHVESFVLHRVGLDHLAVKDLVVGLLGGVGPVAPLWRAVVVVGSEVRVVAIRVANALATLPSLASLVVSGKEVALESEYNRHQDDDLVDSVAKDVP